MNKQNATNRCRSKNTKKSCETQEGNEIFFPSFPFPRIVIPQFPRNISSSAIILCSLSIFCIRFETTSILRANQSCSHRIGPRSKKLFSITIMSGAQKHERRKTSEVERRTERKLETKESVSDSDRQSNG